MEGVLMPLSKTIYPPPDPTALFYRSVDKRGQVLYGKVQSLVIDGANWRAHFIIPGFGPEHVNQNQDYFTDGKWTPIYAVDPKTIESIVEKVAQRVVVVLQEKGDKSPKVVERAMKVATKKTVNEAIDEAQSLLSGK